ncbi:DEAD/DEAH box helicase [Myroides sp. LJL119]
MGFEDLQLNQSILKAIHDLGYSQPTAIQQKAIPVILQEKDIIACAQTGTGKTAAFTMPIIHYLHRLGNTKRTKKAKVLIVTPTRELSQQIADNFQDYAKYTNITHLTIYGGVSLEPQIQQLNKGADVIIGTPGRILDLHKQKHLDLDHLHFLVLDEADLMLDMGFLEDIKKIISFTPDNKQTLLFSATMPISVRELAHNFLKDPQYIAVDPISSTAKTVKQQVYFVEKSDKKKLLVHIIKSQDLSDVLVFTRTKATADQLTLYLNKQSIEAVCFHGDKSQNLRQQALDEFKSKKTKVLIATDVAARGIDIDSLPVVINYDLPNVPETFVHRIGRTGRANQQGLAISFCDKTEKKYWQEIVKFTRSQPKQILNHPYPWQEDKNKSQKKTTSKTIDKKQSETSGKSRKSANAKKNKKRWY